MSFPKCKLCGASAKRVKDWTHHNRALVCCSTALCDADHVMSEESWRALMSPPVVTDAMVERATSGIYTLWWDYNEAKISRETLARAVLEAALKE